MKQLIIGLLSEGSTDFRFLNSIIKRTFEELSFECVGEIEILEIQDILIEKTSFTELVLNAAIHANENLGVMIMCLHSDADARSDRNTYDNKILPALKKVSEYDGKDICKKIVPIVPITMTESWMLADKELFKEELCTNLSFSDLGIVKKPENITDPKSIIKLAITKAYSIRSGRRTHPTIGDIYLPIGQKIKINALKKLKSYNKFYLEARAALVQMGYIVDKNR